MSAALRRIGSGYDNEMGRARFFVPLRYTIVILSILIALAAWGIYRASPAIRLAIDVPVVYRSYSTNEITRIEIGDQVYTPGSDPQWRTRVKEASAGRYELVHVK
jgi:hypothetical protein